jgi:hypothetical protein
MCLGQCPWSLGLESIIMRIIEDTNLEIMLMAIRLAMFNPVMEMSHSTKDILIDQKRIIALRQTMLIWVTGLVMQILEMGFEMVISLEIMLHMYNLKPRWLCRQVEIMVMETGIIPCII